MRCRIHRGCHEIGGNCVEIESQGKRIVLDVGLPLKDATTTPVPDISGLTTPDDSLLGIFISHPHPDHYGLLEQITESVPAFMGKAARQIIEVSDFFTPLPSLGRSQPHVLYSDKQAIQVGPFTVTPLAIDHSAPDSYCLVVEANGKRLLYSGDLRAHGRKADLFQRIVTNPPPNIDVLICEGTQIGRDPDFSYPDECSVAARMHKLFKATKGMCLVWCSGQNTDRIASVFQATESGRQLILDMYTAEIITRRVMPRCQPRTRRRDRLFTAESKNANHAGEGVPHCQPVLSASDLFGRSRGSCSKVGDDLPPKDV